MADTDLRVMLVQFLRSAPVFSAICATVVGLAVLVAVGASADGSFYPALRAGIYLMLIWFFATIYTTKVKEAVLYKPKLRNIFTLRLGHLAATGLLITSLAATTWLLLTTSRYIQERNLFCGNLDPGQIEETELKQSFGSAIFRFAFGIEPWLPDCAASETRVTIVAKPDYLADGKSITKSTTGDISLRLPFSHRRSSCNGRSEGIFKACLPEGITANSGKIVEMNGRNSGDTPKKGNEFIPKTGTNDSLAAIEADSSSPTKETESSQCVDIPWSATSGGRTGIGECRYHGSISFVVELTGRVDTDFESTSALNFEDVTKREVVRGSGNSVFISFEDVVLPERKPGTYTKPLTFWSFSVDGGQWEKRWFREVRSWSDTVDHTKLESNCLEVIPKDEPAGYWITVKC